MRKLYNCLNLSKKRFFIAAVAVSMTALTGNAVALPFVCPFDSQSDFDKFVVKDNDGDGSTWSYDASVGNVTSGGAWGTPDDWLLFPEFTLQGGREYSISLAAWSGWDYYEQHFNILLGQGDDISSYTDKIAEDVMINLSSRNELTYKFKPKTDGNYRIALNVFKSAPFYGVVIDDITVEALADPNAPAAVENLNVIPGEKGALTAVVSFVTPSNSVSGDAIASVDRIVLSRGGAILKEYTDLKPGAEIEFQDTDVPGGKQTYTVTPYAGELQGVSQTADVWVGPDMPASPREFFVSDNLDSSMTMTWTLPDKGANGGYVDPSQVSYKLYQYTKDAEYVFLSDIAAGKESVKFTIDNADISGQQIVLFGLAAVSKQGESQTVMSNEYIIGKPYSLPYIESFGGGEPENGIWIKHYGDVEWSGTDIASFDGDKGAIVFTVPLALKGETYTNSIESGKMDISRCENPGLIFRYLAYPGTDPKLNTLVRVNGGKEYIKLHTLDYITIGGTDNEWRGVYVPLSEYKDASYITISFEATATDPSTAVVVDAVEIRDVSANDLAISYETLPKSAVAGKGMTLYVKVKNEGYLDSGDFKINLYNGQEKVSTIDAAGLPSLAYKTYALSYLSSVAENAVSLRAEVSLPDDAVVGNDVTDSYNMTLARPDYDKETDLKAELSEDNSEVKLIWTGITPEAKTVTDDVEKYDPFTITDLDPWITEDVDQLPSTGLGGYYPHKDEVFPFIVFNPIELDMPVEDEAADFKAHSGDQYFAAITGNGQNDDWLISEKLSGEKQTVSLFARSYNVMYGCEKFEILYSDGTREIADFKAPEVDHSFEVPAEWTEYKVEIPEGAQYFAIHYISPYVWMLMLDDISYSPAVPVVTGYNVYRDKKLVGTLEGNASEYTDLNVAEGAHSYNVTVIYDGQNESDLSNEATMIVSGVSSVVPDADTFMEVYDIEGRLLFSGKSRLDDLGLTPGIYIVQYDGKVLKTTIR